MRSFPAILLMTTAALTTGTALAADVTPVAPTAAKPTPRANPALAVWRGPFGGVPAFDQIRVSDLKPALTAGMKQQLAATARIANNAQPASFENTVAALEGSSRGFDRAGAIFGIYTSTLNDDSVQAVERDMSPILAGFNDQITQNKALFKRIEAVYNTRSTSGLTPEQQRLTWLYYTNFARSGAKLGDADKAKLTAMNQKLATLFTQFSQNVLWDEGNRTTMLTSEAELAGLPDSLRAGAAAEAERVGKKGQWAIFNTRSSVEPFLTFSTRRDLREKVWRNFVSRGDNGDEHDNNKNISDILLLRAQRAKLLGYPTHAHWRLENSMAGTPERAMALMEAVWKPAVQRVHEEVADMQALSDKEGAGIKIEPWDYRYYAEKVRKAKYDLDTNEIKPYLQLSKLREGMFYVAGELFGFRFKQLATGPLAQKKIPIAHPDIEVFEVTNLAGKHVGLWYFDPWARPGKNSGAWMNAYRNQERFDSEVTTIVSNNANFVKGKPGEPVLISWDDATTLFHEFGHALHGLSSNVSYPSVSGTNVPRDYVEFPSQLLEHWLSTPEVLNKYALHYQTGKPIPRELVTKIERAAAFNQGFKTVEYLSAALIDMKLHLAGETPIDPRAFERDTLTTLGMPKEIVMRHRTPQFNHVFSGDGYSAGYYSYLWADTLTADAYEAFTEASGPYDKAIAKRLRDHVFTIGNTVDPAEAYRAFRGRDAGIDALMRKRGFAPPRPTR
jgi:peptidyl-dipeptidase Dcp